MKVAFQLTYDGPALRTHEMNVRDLAPAMLAVGEAFEALNSLYNGKTAKIAVNVRAHEPGCFTVVFDVVQAFRETTQFFAGTEITAANNLMALLFGGGSVSGGLIWLVRKMRGKKPDRIEKLQPDMFRLFIGDETFDVPIQLLRAYQEIRIRKAIEGFASKPLRRPGIEEMRVEQSGRLIEQVKTEEEAYFRAPPDEGDIVVDDTRQAAYAIRDLSFDEDGTWKLFDGSAPIKARIEDEVFLARIERDEISFSAHDILLCRVHFVQRRTSKGLENEYTVEEVIQHIPAAKQLSFPTPESSPQ